MSEFRQRSGNRQGISGNGSSSYFAPADIKEAVRLLAQYGGELNVIAGGTDLLVEYYEKLYKVRGWLDLKNLDGLKEIDLYDDRIEIGTLVTHTQLEISEVIGEHLPVLAKAAYEVGSPQIRNRGTIGGNIVTASPAGDLLPALMAYDACFELVSQRGKRTIPAAEFFTGPKKTVLRDDELLSRVVIPLPGENICGSWFKVGKRKALVISSINLALVVNFNGEKVIEDARVCLGSVAPTPVEIRTVKAEMAGKSFEDLDFERLGQLVADGISPIDDIRGTREYRHNVAAKIMINALEEIEEVVRSN